MLGAVGNGTFRSTHWSIVRGGASADAELRRVSLERLCNQYWFPLYAHLRRKGRDADRAADLVQGFFAQLLSRDGLSTVKEDVGPFRAWLMGALRNHERDEVARERALKRGGGAVPIPIDAEEGERDAPKGNRYPRRDDDAAARGHQRTESSTKVRPRKERR